MIAGCKGLKSLSIDIHVDWDLVAKNRVILTQDMLHLLSEARRELSASYRHIPDEMLNGIKNCEGFKQIEGLQAFHMRLMFQAPTNDSQPEWRGRRVVFLTELKKPYGKVYDRSEPTEKFWSAFIKMRNDWRDREVQSILSFEAELKRMMTGGPVRESR